MVSRAIMYTFLFTMSLFLLISSINADSVNDKIESDGLKLSVQKRAAENNNDLEDEYRNYMLGKYRFATRGVRLPSESILLGRRRLPDEAVLLGRRGLSHPSNNYNKRR